MGRSRNHTTRKRIAASKAREAATAALTCHLRRMPIEIITEVVSWLLNPIDLLALTRTCKFFCQMLTDSSNAIVWKRMRTRFQPLPVPDPPWKYTECSWAAFIFGPNKCMICRRATFQLPWSFSCELFKCESCLAIEFYNKKLFVTRNDERVLGPMKEYIEEYYNVLQKSSAIPNRWGLADNLFPLLEERRMNEIGVALLSSVYIGGLQPLLDELSSASAGDVEATQAYLVSKAARAKAFVKATNDAFQWSINVTRRSKKIQKQMITQAKHFAKDAKLDYECMFETPAFTQILEAARSDRLKSIAKLLDQSKRQILAEMEEPVKRKLSVATRESFEVRQAQIFHHYNSKITYKPYFPSFKVFKSLPSVKLLLQSFAKTPVDILADLRSEPIVNLIDRDVSQWVERAIAGARLLLSKGDEKDDSQDTEGSTSEDKGPNIEDLPSSLFICTMCNTMHPRCRVMGAMNFKEMCRHECKINHKASRDQPEWSISNFAVAKKAQSAVKAMLASKERSEVPFIIELRPTKDYWTCNQCSDLQPMEYTDIIHHSNRHDTVDISYFRERDLEEDDKMEWEKSQSITNERPVSCAALVCGREKEQAEKRQFVCAHCFKPTAGRFSKVFDFNALRSHVKAKHDVTTIRSEDYFFDPSIVERKSVKETFILSPETLDKLLRASEAAMAQGGRGAFHSPSQRYRMGGAEPSSS